MSRVPSALYHPNIGQIIRSASHGSRTMGGPAHSPFTWVRKRSKYSTARCAAASLAQTPGGAPRGGEAIQARKRRPFPTRPLVAEEVVVGLRIVIDCLRSV